MTLLGKLEGYRTYIICVLLIVIEVLRFYGVLDAPVANSLEVFLGAGGLAALRVGLKK